MNGDRALVIGYGNPLRRDDGAGWAVARKLMGMVSPNKARVMTLHQLTPELAVDLSRVERAVFIDASVEQAESQKPGTVSVREIFASDSEQTSSHYLSPQTLVALSKRLYGSQPRAWEVAIVAGDLGHGEDLSAEVESAVDEAARRVLELVLT